MMQGTPNEACGTAALLSLGTIWLAEEQVVHLLAALNSYQHSINRWAKVIEREIDFVASLLVVPA
jgi:hypothetical protein